MNFGGYNGSDKLVGESGKFSQQKTITRNCKFTMIGLISFYLQGKLPVGSKDAGINIIVHPYDNTTDKDFIIKNSNRESTLQVD